MDISDYYEQYWETRIEKGQLYEDAIPQRIPITLDLIEDKKPRRVLDIGCGDGVLGRCLEGLPHRPDVLYGCDISKKAVNLSEEFYDEVTELDLESGKLDQYYNEEFDMIILLETLEHLFDPSLVLIMCREILAENGTLITSFPNFVYWKYRLEVLFGSVPEGYTLEGSEEHIQNFTIETFTSLLKSNGFRPEDIYPAINVPWWVPNVFAKKFPNLTANQLVVSSELQ